MSAQLAVVEERSNIPALAMDEAELLKALEASLYPGARAESIKMVVAYCRANRKDPFKRPVHIVPMWVKGADGDGKMRDVIMPGINDYRTDAMRTGAFAGLSDATFGPDKTLTLGGVEITFPEWCEIKAYRMVGGIKAEFSSGKVRWLETYATAKRDSVAPNAMWKKRPYGQLEKCAEALALRRAFPEIGGQNVAEEVEGKVIGEEIDVTPSKPEIQMPKPRPAAHGTISAAEIKDAPIVSQSVAKVNDVIDVEPAPANDEPASLPPQPEPASATGELASDGAKKFLIKKLGDRDPVAFAKEHGVDWNHLTVTGFATLKGAL